MGTLIEIRSHVFQLIGMLTFAKVICFFLNLTEQYFLMMPRNLQESEIITRVNVPITADRKSRRLLKLKKKILR